MTPEDIRRARNALGLTQAEMAQALGFETTNNPAARVSELERGASEISASRALLLEAYLGGFEPRGPIGKLLRSKRLW